MVGGVPAGPADHPRAPAAKAPSAGPGAPSPPSRPQASVPRFLGSRWGSLAPVFPSPCLRAEPDGNGKAGSESLRGGGRRLCWSFRPQRCEAWHRSASPLPPPPRSPPPGGAPHPSLWRRRGRLLGWGSLSLDRDGAQAPRRTGCGSGEDVAAAEGQTCLPTPQLCCALRDVTILGFTAPRPLHPNHPEHSPPQDGPQGAVQACCLLTLDDGPRSGVSHRRARRLCLWPRRAHACPRSPSRCLRPESRSH